MIQKNCVDKAIYVINVEVRKDDRSSVTNEGPKNKLGEGDFFVVEGTKESHLFVSALCFIVAPEMPPPAFCW